MGDYSPYRLARSRTQALIVQKVREARNRDRQFRMNQGIAMAKIVNATVKRARTSCNIIVISPVKV